MTGNHKARIRYWVWIVVLTVTLALWASAHVFGFIGNTSFIGDVSMVALVLTAATGIEASLPSVEE